MSLKVEKLKIDEIKTRKTPELDVIVTLMSKHGFMNGYDLLPTSTKHKVSFQLNNTYSAFANAIRRTLVEDIPTKSLLINEKDIVTDDEFIAGMSDVLVKNLGLLPITQFSDVVDYPDRYDIYLYVFNNTTEIIDVKAKDISVVRKVTKKSKKETGKRGGAEELDVAESTLDLDNEITEDVSTEDVLAKSRGQKDTSYKESTYNLVPDDNILLMRLRPGKYLKLRNITIQTGTSAVDAGKFSLLNNIMYEPLDMQPYDQFTGKGTRSIDHDCKSFQLEFTTCGNILPKEVMKLVHTKLSSDLTDLKKKIQLYINAGSGSYYSGQDCEVTLRDDVYNFKFIGHYISELAMIAMCCYKLDDNIPFCAATVERYDSIVGLLRIKHVDFTKIILKAIETCQKDLDTLLAVF